MTRARPIGHLLLWVGFFAGAYLAVAQVEKVADKWSTVNWPLYFLALAVGVTGVVLLRATQRQAATHADKLDADIKALELSLNNLVGRLTSMLAAADQFDVFEVHQVIDTKLVDDINSFVAARETLIHTFGMQDYADLMTDFSIAERNINRAWSASADGYVDEVWLSLERAQQRLQAAATRLAQCKRQAATSDTEA